jgi:hypothetical protein
VTKTWHEGEQWAELKGHIPYSLDSKFIRKDPRDRLINSRSANDKIPCLTPNQPGISLQHSQHPTSDSYRQVDKSSPQSHTMFV